MYKEKEIVITRNFFYSIILFFGAFTTLAFISPAERLEKSYIQRFYSISYENKGDNVVGIIELNNGMLLRWEPKSIENRMLENWERGDQVFFWRHHKYPGIYLMNKDSDILYQPWIKMEPETLKQLPTIAKMTSVTRPGKDFDKLYVLLSDGTLWLDDYHDDEDTEFWKVGDKILVTNNGWTVCLINVPVAQNGRCDLSLIYVDVVVKD